MEKWATYFTNPAFAGWRLRICSNCGTYHPGSCEIGKDPEFQKIYANRKQIFPVPTRK